MSGVEQAGKPALSVERCLSGLRAAQALLVGSRPGERRQWEARERWWLQQLSQAENRK